MWALFRWIYEQFTVVIDYSVRGPLLADPSRLVRSARFNYYMLVVETCRVPAKVASMIACKQAFYLGRRLDNVSHSMISGKSKIVLS